MFYIYIYNQHNYPIYKEKKQEMNDEPLYKEITTNYRDSGKWNIPTKTSK